MVPATCVPWPLPSIHRSPSATRRFAATKFAPQMLVRFDEMSRWPTFKPVSMTPTGNGRAAPGEDPRRPPQAEGVGAHRGDGRVVRCRDGAHGLHGQHEVRRRDGFERAPLDDRRVGPDVGVERPDHGAHLHEGAAPAAVGVARHQRDEHRHPLRRRACRPGKELRIRRHGAQAADRFQRRDAFEARAVSRQPGADQASRGAERLRAERPQPPGQILGRCLRREPDPAEGPVAPRAFGSAHKPVERIGRIEPFRSRSVFGSPVVELLVERQPGHLSVMPDESVARRRRAVLLRPGRHGSGLRGRGRRHGSGRPRAAFHVDAGRCRRDRAGVGGRGVGSRARRDRWRRAGVVEEQDAETGDRAQTDDATRNPVHGRRLHGPHGSPDAPRDAPNMAQRPRAVNRLRAPRMAHRLMAAGFPRMRGRALATPYSIARTNSPWLMSLTRTDPDGRYGYTLQAPSKPGPPPSGKVSKYATSAISRAPRSPNSSTRSPDV